MRVAEDGAADRAGRARPRLEARAAVIDRPAHEAVDRDRGVGADVPLVDRAHVAAARADHEAAHAGVRHEHVRSAAEHRHRHARRARQRQRRHDLVAAARLDQPVGRAADAKRRQRRERHVGAQPIGAERLRAEAASRSLTAPPTPRPPSARAPAR